MTMVGAATPISVAFPTPLLPSVEPKIVTRKRVAVGACVSSRTQRTTVILGLSDRFEMVRSDATSHAAEVIEMESIGDGANEVLIGPAVRSHHLVSVPESCVTTSHARCPSPQPALSVDPDLGEESFFSAHHASILPYKGI